MSLDVSATPPDPAPDAVPRDPLRPPDTVMRLARLGSLHQTRLSFTRALIRRMVREGWRLTRTRFDIGPDETGEACYRLDTPQGHYTFVVFAENLDPDQRSDRVIAERWDYTFALVEGTPDAAEMARLRANVPKQEAGRMCSHDVVLSRGNKSERLFEPLIATLAAGRQPTAASLAQVGYLLRTTAVYGNGKFGLADYARLQTRGAFSQPFSAQMLTVYAAREFSLDLVESLARQRDPARAVPLDPALRRALGVGNATGLGMAPFIVSHPKLIHAWVQARETAIARVKALPEASPEARARFATLLRRARRHVGEWTTGDAAQRDRIAVLRGELDTLVAELAPPAAQAAALPEQAPWRWLADSVTARFGLETQELIHSLMLEPYPALVDSLEDAMGADETLTLRPEMRVAALIGLLEDAYAWALAIDTEDAAETGYFWYRSETKEEPRLGARGCDPGVDREMPLGIGVRVKSLYAALCALDPAARGESVAAFLVRYPQWRGLVRRVQTLAELPYAEVRDNLVSETMRPIDLLRFKLSVFGAVKFDPKSDRWTRITLFQGAPTMAALHAPDADPDDWAVPTWPEGF